MLTVRSNVEVKGSQWAILRVRVSDVFIRSWRGSSFGAMFLMRAQMYVKQTDVCVRYRACGKCMEGRRLLRQAIVYWRRQRNVRANTCDQAGSVWLPKFSSRSPAYASRTAKKIPPKPKTRSCEALATAPAHPSLSASNGPHSQACRSRDAALR